MTEDIVNKVLVIRMNISCARSDYNDAIKNEDYELLLKSAIELSQLYKQLVDELQVAKAMENGDH